MTDYRVSVGLTGCRSVYFAFSNHFRRFSEKSVANQGM